MFLQPSEVGFLKHLKEARVPLEEFEFPSNKISNVQSQLDLVKVAKSFGFQTPPRVNITLGASMSRDKKQQGRRAYGSQPKQGHKFRRQ